MRLAIALCTLVLSASGASPHTQVDSKVAVSDKSPRTSVVAKVEDPGDKALVKSDASWTSGAKTTLAQVTQYGYNLFEQKTGLGEARKLIASYYKDFEDDPLRAITKAVTGVGYGLWGGAVTISKTMGTVIVDLSSTVTSIYWFEDNSIFACARRGSEPIFASVKQYTLAREGNLIRPIRLSKLDKDKFSSVDEDPPIEFLRDPSPHTDAQLGIEIFPFTSSEEPSKKYIIVNLENSGEGFRAIEPSNLFKSIKLYTKATDINGKEILAEIRPLQPARKALEDEKIPEPTYKEDQAIVLKLGQTSECVDGLKAKLKRGVEHVDELNAKLKRAVKHANTLEKLSAKSTRSSPEKRTSGDAKKGKGAGTKKPLSRPDTQASKKKSKDFSSGNHGSSTKRISKGSSKAKTSARGK